MWSYMEELLKTSLSASILIKQRVL
jgi:hypothetical protein